MLNNLLKVKYKKIIYLQAGKTESGPPIGTILGNIGVNASKFTQDFNNFTKDLPIFFFVKVLINIYENRTFNFLVTGFSITFAFKRLKFEKTIKVLQFDRFYEHKILCINFKDVILLALYKFNNMDIKKVIVIVLGILKSMNLIIIFKKKKN